MKLTNHLYQHNLFVMIVVKKNKFTFFFDVDSNRAASYLYENVAKKAGQHGAYLMCCKSRWF